MDLGGRADPTLDGLDAGGVWRYRAGVDQRNPAGVCRRNPAGVYQRNRAGVDRRSGDRRRWVCQG